MTSVPSRVANAFGVVGSDANAIEPGKRMLSSMSPSIVTRDGKVSLVLGTPGGSRIFTSIFRAEQRLRLRPAAGKAVARSGCTTSCCPRTRSTTTPMRR